MKIYRCDVCGKLLNGDTPDSVRYTSDLFDFDLCADHKMVEHRMCIRDLYLRELKRLVNEQNQGDEKK